MNKALFNHLVDMLADLIQQHRSECVSLYKEHKETMRDINNIEKNRRKLIERGDTNPADDLLGTIADLRKYLAFLSGRIQSLNKVIRTEQAVYENMKKGSRK